MIADWIVAFLMLVIVVLTFFVWKVYERIAWLTGAMETQSDLMLRIEACRGINGNPIELVWWDPSVADPPVQREHGKPVQFNRIYVFVPPKYRRSKPSFGERLRNLFWFSD